MNEEIRPCTFDSNYEVSSLGRVRRVGGKWRRPWPVSKGALAIDLWSRNRRQRYYLHRLVMFAFVGPPPTSLHEVAHWDGDPTNNELSNLRWATHVENEADKIRHDRTLRGERSSSAKLTRDQVVEIANLRADGLLLREIGVQFGVTEQHVGKIIARKTWRHIHEEPA